VSQATFNPTSLAPVSQIEEVGGDENQRDGDSEIQHGATLWINWGHGQVCCNAMRHSCVMNVARAAGI